MTAVTAHQQFDMARLLIDMARSMIESKTTELGIEAIRQLPIGVQNLRSQLLDEEDVRLIDFKAVCLVELMIALTLARDEGRADRSAWIEPMVLQIVSVMEADLKLAEQARRP